MCVRLAADDTWTLSYRDLLYSENLTSLPADIAQISDTRWLYAYSFYNGPLSGMVSTPYGDLWAESVEECGIVADDSCGFNRRYLLYQLNPEAMAAERARHNLFRAHVGDYMDYDGDGCRMAGAAIAATSRWRGYFDGHSGPPDLAGCQLVGFFEW